MSSVDIFAPTMINRLSGSRIGYIEDFKRLPGINADIAISLNQDFELLGTSAVTADLSFNAEGGINLATHGGATDSAILLPHLDTAQTGWAGQTWGTDQETQWGCYIKTDTALTNTTIWAGLKLTNTPVSTTDNDEAFFRYQNGTNTTWQCVYDIANAGPTSGESSVTVAAATEYRLWITIDASRLARFWINGALVFTTPALSDATDFKPYIGVLSATDATAKKIRVMETFISRKIA